MNDVTHKFNYVTHAGLSQGTFVSNNFTNVLTLKKMKKTIFFALLMIMSMSASTVFAGNLNAKNAIENPAIPAKTDSKLSEKQVTAMKNRVEEIRDMDKTNMSASEKIALRKELKEIKQTVNREGGYVYIGGATLVLIIILILILV